MKDQRKANFTSSSIHRLCANGRAKGSIGAPFFSYVEEKRNEILAGRSLNNEANADSTSWGKVCEQIAHNELGLEYVLEPDKRYKHESLPWSGAPDGVIPGEVVTDIKSPWTLTSFFSVYNDQTVEGLKATKKEWYWQLISNSLLTGIPECELILFMPKRSMIYKIQEESVKACYSFQNKDEYEMPWTADNSYIPSITKIRFTPPQEDLDLLQMRVEAAAKCLIDDEFYKFLLNSKTLLK